MAFLSPMRISGSLIFYAISAALFASGTLLYFTATPCTPYRLVVGVIRVIGFAVLSLVFWKQL
jgi:hypothetical protein